jgi:hypothetical protein
LQCQFVETYFPTIHGGLIGRIGLFKGGHVLTGIKNVVDAETVQQLVDFFYTDKSGLDVRPDNISKNININIINQHLRQQ